jgi:hypothetical protein
MSKDLSDWGDPGQNNRERKNGYDKIWKWRKVDVLFLVGIGLIVYGAIIVRVELIVAGGGIAGIPVVQRGDKP